MPTMGRLVGAILFGALAWYVSLRIVPLFPDGTYLGYFQEINTVFGLIAGWSIAGPRAGTGYSPAISYGLTTMISMVVMALGLNSSLVMVRRSLRKLYDGPGEAIIDVFALFVEYGALMLTPGVIGTLVVGGVCAGLLTEAVGRRFS